MCISLLILVFVDFIFHFSMLKKNQKVKNLLKKMKWEDSNKFHSLISKIDV